MTSDGAKVSFGINLFILLVLPSAGENGNFILAQRTNIFD